MVTTPILKNANNLSMLKKIRPLYRWFLMYLCLSACRRVPGSGTLCASWQCLEVPRGPPPSLAVQFVGSGASLSGMDVELVGSRYRMSLVKKRFATGDTSHTSVCFLALGCLVEEHPSLTHQKLFITDIYVFLYCMCIYPPIVYECTS